MSKVIDENGEMVLQVNRVLHGKTWWFELQIPQEHWEDLFHATEEHGPQTVSAAYARAKVFWDRLVDENADALEQGTVPGAANRHFEEIWPDYLSLEAAYRKHGRPKDRG
jgi:hypothetical protein